MSLALLPADHILPAWEELKNEPIASLSYMEKRQKADYTRYMDSYWMRQVGPQIMSVAFCPRRRNNAVEAHNRRLNQKTRIAHPGPFSFSKIVAEELNTAEREIITMDQGNAVREDSRTMFSTKEARILRWQRSVQRQVLHHSEFLVKTACLNKRYLMLTHRSMEAASRRFLEEGEEEQAAENAGEEEQAAENAEGEEEQAAENAGGEEQAVDGSEEEVRDNFYAALESDFCLARSHGDSFFFYF